MEGKKGVRGWGLPGGRVTVTRVTVDGVTVRQKKKWSEAGISGGAGDGHPREGNECSCRWAPYTPEKKKDRARRTLYRAVTVRRAADKRVAPDW